LRAEQLLDIDAAQGRRVDAMALFLGARITGQMGSGVGVAVGVTIEAGDAEGWGRSERRSSSRLNCCCAKRGDQQTQPVELLGIE